VFVTREREIIQLLNFWCTCIEVELRGRAAPTQTGNAVELSRLQILENIGKDLISFIPDDDVKLWKALKNLPVQHSRVRTAE
jgi:hypothetical protein